MHSKLRRGIDIDPNRNFLKIAILRVHRSNNPSPNLPILGYLMLWQFLSWHSRNSLSPSLWFERNWPEHIQFLLGLSMEGWGIVWISLEVNPVTFSRLLVAVLVVHIFESGR